MRSSFAHFRNALNALVVATVMQWATGCASVPPPAAELGTAQQALARAEAADADQYAADVLETARQALQAAQVAMTRGRNEEARDAAVNAATAADLAWVRSSTARVRADWQQTTQALDALYRQLQIAAPPPPEDPLDIPPVAGSPAQRLQALEADARLNAYAQYERLQARQALAALDTVPRKALPAALARAQQRVEIAELAARVEAARRELERMQQTRSELLLEASRREAERARLEAERARLQAQVQAEEAERLRQQAQQAEVALGGAQAEEQAKAAAARAREAALARQEAELVAGAKLPPMQQDARGEVFILASNAFVSGQARLTPTAAASLKALGLYLAALPERTVQVIGHTDNQGTAAANRSLSERRAQQVRAALVAAGVARSRISAEGRGADAPVADNRTAAGRAKNRRVEIVVTIPAPVDNAR